MTRPSTLVAALATTAALATDVTAYIATMAGMVRIKDGG
jgi:hypothetical protein